MSRYVKILVPDDFDADVIDIPQSETLVYNAPVFQPQYTPVLDHGFVGLVDFMGDDMAVVNAARVSYGKGTNKTRSDQGLIRYLMRHLHTTPFEMVNFKFHVKAPIFVFRQWHRHRTFSINEYSARYSEMSDEMYHPDLGHLAPQSSSNRQGRSGDLLTEDEYNAVMSAVDHIYDQSFQTYKHILGADAEGNVTPPPDAIEARLQWCREAALEGARRAREDALEGGRENPFPTEESVEEHIRLYMQQNGVAHLTEDFPGIARELARMVLPVATYSQMYWSGNMHNLFHFLNLRCDPHAQYEIRVFADAILDLIEPFAPWSVQAFKDYLKDATRLSRMETEVVRKLMAMLDNALSMDLRDVIEAELKEEGCSNREIGEFVSRFVPSE